jgi:collagenase-like PrtC family protease
MELTLGPVLFNWSPEKWRDFHYRVADEAPVDNVVVGDIVCSKRSPFLADHLPDVIERLAAAGKQVMLGSLILVSLPRERRQMAEMAKDADSFVEINDLSCLASVVNRPHAIGPFVNVYNEATAGFFASRGATRICLPPELPLTSIRTIASALPDVVIEVFGFGKAPLAISARCYHARVHKLSKDNCKFVCEQDPDGLRVKTMDGQDFLSVNGVQTLSHGCVDVLDDIQDLVKAGVRALRLSPQNCDMVAVAKLYREVLDGRRDTAEAENELASLYPNAPFVNGFLHALPGAVHAPLKGAAARPH